MMNNNSCRRAQKTGVIVHYESGIRSLPVTVPIDDPESLLDVELPLLVASGHDLLLRVEAVSVNPVDTKVRSPKETVEKSPRVLGWDAAGVVEAVGAEVTRFKPERRSLLRG